MASHSNECRHSSLCLNIETNTKCRLLLKMFRNEISWRKSLFFIQIQLKFVRMGPFDNKSSLFQIMAWRRKRRHSITWTNAVHVYNVFGVSRPQRVKYSLKRHLSDIAFDKFAVISHELYTRFRWALIYCAYICVCNGLILEHPCFLTKAIQLISPLDKMAAVSHTIFSYAFSWM